jgi:lipopolysaccharide/colanic/teichoic acid biosynthesis glycosyltransferase
MKPGKCFFDFFFALILVILFLPLIGCIALIIRLFDGPPVFFKQLRPGKDGVPFTLIKFRTMKPATILAKNVLPDDKIRLTRLGIFLRQTSLDELPELFNIIKGDMSLVGPRPLLMEYLPLYNETQQKRHWVKPGLTGWAQINGRNALSWEDKFAMDVWYVENRSFWLDLKILFITLIKAIKREGISHQGEATMSRFTGSKS